MEKTGDISLDTPQPEAVCNGRCPRQKTASAVQLTEKVAQELADSAATRVADAVAEAVKNPQ